MPTTEMSADFGAQRVKGMSLMTAMRRRRSRRRRSRPGAGKDEQVTSLIESFNYPKYGPGPDVGEGAPRS